MMSEYAEALANFGALVDEKTGIIRSVELIKVSELDPEVFLAHAEPCDTTPLTGIRAANRGAACSTTPERAIVRACGESVERYCAAFFEVRAMHLASEDEMTADRLRFVSVHDLYPFAHWQYEQAGFPYQRVTATCRVRWVPGTSAMTAEPVWLPASCVYVPYLFDVAVELFTHMPISTGLAAGPSVDACIRKGTLEILERDALMVVWYARLPVPRIDPESCYGISPEIDQLLSAARSGGPTWYLNLLTLDVDVPVISAALINPGSPPLTSFGLSADLDPARALLLALEEAALTRTLVNRSQEILDNPGYVHDRLETLRDHLLAHATSPGLRHSIRFLTDAGPMMRFDALLKREQDRPPVVLKDRLAAAGLEAIWVDVTTPDVLDFGFRVVRTTIPGMQPLDNDHRYRHLGGRRLLSIPTSLGYPDLTPETLNSDPHPFP